MNRRTISIVIAALLSLGGTVILTGSPVTPYGQDASKDKSAVKADGAQSAADAKEVKRLSALSGQAGDKTRQAHQVYVQKIEATKAAIKSSGGKGPAVDQARKDEAAAKTDWMARMKEQQDVDAQRKAAIGKLHDVNEARSKDVHKLDSDESKPHSTSTH